MRSATSNTSLRLCEMTSTAMPRDFRVSYQVQHHGGLGHAEGRGGLVHDHQPGVLHHRPGHRHRLALAARKRPTAWRIERTVVTDSSLSVSRGSRSMRGLVEQAVRDAARGPGTCSGRCPGCRTAPGPGRRWRSRGRWRPSGPRMRTGWPSQRICPASGCQMPEMVLIRVDLPAPLSPMRAVTWPAGTSRSTPDSASTAPKRLTTRESDRSSRPGARWLGRSPGAWSALADQAGLPGVTLIGSECRRGSRRRCYGVMPAAVQSLA